MISPRGLGRIGAGAVVSGALYSTLMLEKAVHRVDDDRRERFVRAWARALLRVMNVRVVGASARSAEGPRLVVANHRSTLDILLVLDLFGGEMLSRGDMAEWPVMGRLAKIAGTIFVERGDASSGAGAMRKMRDRLEAKRSIGIFPEGTTFPGDEVRPFHAGAFVLAARAKVDLLPVGIAYASDDAIYGDEPISAHGRRLLEARETRVAVAVGEPITPRGMGLVALTEHTRAAVQSLVHRARAML